MPCSCRYPSASSSAGRTLPSRRHRSSGGTSSPTRRATGSAPAPPTSARWRRVLLACTPSRPHHCARSSPSTYSMTRKRPASSWPSSWTRTRPGCRRRSTARNSRLKRRMDSGESACARFSATRSPRCTSSASQTVPMPPRPSSRSRRKRGERASPLVRPSTEQTLTCPTERAALRPPVIHTVFGQGAGDVLSVTSSATGARPPVNRRRPATTGPWRSGV